METEKRGVGFLVFFVFSTTLFAQVHSFYPFQQDDSLRKHAYYEQVLAAQKEQLEALPEKNKKDYKEIYESRFKAVADLFQSSRSVTDPVAHQYLQAILKKITAANPELESRPVRLIFSRDWWPNAYSMGEGTLVVNAGLMIFLENEAQLVFVLCHELSHYYLDHSNKAIQKNVELVNSDAFKQEMKKIEKQEYGAGKMLEALFKNLAFGSRQHSRDNEAEADQHAFELMRNTGYDCNGIRTCLELLDKTDDSLVYKPLVLEKVFNFPEYHFKTKWIKNESSLFSEMSSDDSPLTQKEKDSLKTHPDCAKRIQLLANKIDGTGGGKEFLVNEALFNKLKKDFYVEMTEQEFRDEDLGRNLYFNLLMLQSGDNMPLAIYSVARDLNLMYEKQASHQLGLATNKESRGSREDYNLLLRMIDRIRLNELAELSYYFCENYQSQMTGYKAFETERKKAIHNKQKQQ